VTLGIGRTGPLGPVRFAIAETTVSTAHGPSRHGGPAHDAAEREALAVLASVEGVGPMTLARLLSRLGGAHEVLDLARRPGAEAHLVEASRGSPDDVAGRASLTARAASQLVDVALRAEAVLAAVASAGLTVVTIHDEAYPARLRAIDLPPHVLFVQGDVGVLAADRALAVVGTRRASEAGRRIAARIATSVCRAGAVVISGLAVGIDGSAHAATVAEVEGGEGRAPTVAVLGGGHRHLFPRAHRALARRILSTGGALVSEFGPDTEPNRGTFPRRNRIISGLAEATVVVEARVRSGALITAAWALQQGRGCYLVPGRIDDPMASGCLAFLRETGGEARIVASVDLLLEDLGLATGVRATGAPDAPGDVPLAPLVELGGTAALVGERLVAGLATADELVSHTRLPVATVLAALTLLETHGLVVGAYGRYRPAGRLAGMEPARRGVR
jgi:DNA processing protein